MRSGHVPRNGRSRSPEYAPEDPLSRSPVKANFTFQDEKLRYFSTELLDTAFELAQKQIPKKYGAGQVKDEQKEEQCI